MLPTAKKECSPLNHARMSLLEGLQELDESELVVIGEFRSKVVAAIFDKIRAFAKLQKVWNKVGENDPRSRGVQML